MRHNVYSLLLKHQRLDAQLRLEQSYRAPDSARVSKMKKLKLAIKDRLHRLTLAGTQRLA